MHYDIVLIAEKLAITNSVPQQKMSPGAVCVALYLLFIVYASFLPTFTLPIVASYWALINMSEFSASGLDQERR